MNKNKFRSLFPIFEQKNQFVYFDSAATSLKPRKVIDSICEFYKFNGLSTKSAGALSMKVNELIEETRNKTASFINSMPEEVIFTKGTTDSLNMLSKILGQYIKPNDEIIISELEHNSSFLPWLRIAHEKKAKLIFIPLDENNKITAKNFEKVLSDKTKVVVLIHISNVLGYETPVKEITRIARQKKILIILDAAQSASCKKLDVKDLGVDFMAFSTHKMYGPFGLGILFGKKNLLETYIPNFLGGGSIQEVFKNDFTYKELPYRYEPGTPNISAIIAFKRSLEFIEEIGLDNICNHNKNIIVKITERLKKMNNIKIYNPGTNNILLFNFNNIHAHDVEHFLAQENIYLRTGKHCSNLIAQKLNQVSTIRISVGIYNDLKDVDILIQNLIKIQKFFDFV